MARMVATKTALSVRVDALSDADSKSELSAPSIGVENRAKLESRLRALEYQGDSSGVKRFSDGGKKQPRFEMTGGASTYNDAADLVPTQRDPMEAAVKAVLDTKEEKRRAKEEKKRLKEEKNAKKVVKEAVAEDGTEDEMDVDGEDSKEKKRKRREAEVHGDADVAMVRLVLVLSVRCTSSDRGIGGCGGDRRAAKGKEKGQKGGEGSGCCCCCWGER
jgi:nucleolar protein 58